MATAPRGRTEETDRSVRIPLGSARQKLSLTPEKQAELKFRKLVPRWINDKSDRLNDALRGGYQFETSASVAAGVGTANGGNDISAKPGIDSRISRVVGTDEGGHPIRAYLMTIPQDLWEADQKEKQDEITKKEKGMMKGLDDKGKPVPGMYVPASGGPSIEYKSTE